MINISENSNNINNINNIPVKNNVINNINTQPDNNISPKKTQNNLDKADDKEILIREKLNEYKMEMNNKLIQMINEEKEKEIKREEDYQKAQAENNEEVINKIKNERINSLNQITAFRDQIFVAVKDYEEQLKKNNN